MVVIHPSLHVIVVGRRRGREDDARQARGAGTSLVLRPYSGLASGAPRRVAPCSYEDAKQTFAFLRRPAGRRHACDQERTDPMERQTGVWRDFRVAPGRWGRGRNVFRLRVN
jgi:hypothetical protein